MTETLSILRNEAEIVDSAKRDPLAFAPIYDHYFARIYSYIRYRVRDGTTADDLTAQVFEQALRTCANYRADLAPLSAWLFGIARHIVGSHFREQKRQRWFSFERFGHQSSPAPPPEEIAAQNESHARLLAAMAQLKERDRDILALKFSSGLTNRRIAALLGLSESNVGVIVYRAMQHLRGLLGEEQL